MEVRLVTGACHVCRGDSLVMGLGLIVLLPVLCQAKVYQD